MTSENASPSILPQARIARAAAFAILGWMFLPLLTGQIYVCDDLLNYHLPIRQFYSSCLQNGDAFDWMPSLFSGYFLTGSGQAGTYHPWHWLLYRCLPLETAFNLEVLSSYPFMLFGMKLFLQRHFQRPDAAWLGAIVFSFSGFCTLHFLHPNAIAVVSHIPWLLLSLDVILRDCSGCEATAQSHPVGGATGVPYTRRSVDVIAVISLALLTGSQLLLGYPQYVWFSLLAEIIYCLGFVSWNALGFCKLAIITSLKVLGLGLGAVQILPSMAALSESDRGAMSPEFFFEHPLTAADMLQWFNPYLTGTRVFGQNTHELGLYCGAIPWLLAIVAITRLRSHSSHRRLLQVILALGLLALWLSFGKAGGLYVVQTWLPMIGKFRWPSRILVLLHFVVAVFATAGYVRISGTALAAGAGLKTDGNVSAPCSQQLPRILYFVPIASILTSLVAPVICGREHAASRMLLLLGPILFVLAAILVRDVSRGRYSPAFMLFLAGDLAAYGFTYEALSRKQSMQEIVAAMRTPPGSPNDGRVIAEVQLQTGDEQFHGNKLLLDGWHQADGYEGLMSSRSLLGENLTMDGLRIAGVRWVINEGRHNSIAGLQQTDDAKWLKVPDPLPRARLTHYIRQVSNTTEALKYLSAAGPAVVEDDPEQRSAIEEFTPSTSTRNDSTTAMSDTVKIVSDRPGLIEVDVECEARQLLILSESYSSGWKVSVNGEWSSVFRAEVDYMACEVPAGQSRVQFRFEPDSVTAGFRISVASLWLLCLGTAMFYFLKFRGISQRKPEVVRTTADGRQ